MDDQLGLFIDNQKDFLNFLKTRYSLFHESNFFFRDLHYGVMAYLKLNKRGTSYAPSEDLAWRIVKAYEEAKIFMRIDERTWMLNYLPFKKAPTKPAIPAKPVPAPKPVAAPPASLRIVASSSAAKPEAMVQGSALGS